MDRAIKTGTYTCSPEPMTQKKLTLRIDETGAI